MFYRQIRHWLTTGCITVLVVLTGFANSYAQGTPPAGRTCAAMDVLAQQLAKDPDMANRMAELESFTRQYIEQRSLDSLSGLRTLPVTRTIPVYVHVLYNTDLENIDAAQIQSQITVLNQDFRHMASTPGYGDTGYVLGVDSNIEFVMEPVPTGSTSGGTVDAAGINRKPVSVIEWGTTDDMKRSLQGGIDPVTPNTHMNIWICNIGSGILGYAQFPGGDPATDGVVISPPYFGSSDIYPTGSYSAPYDLGRTATHEVGHYLNLRHIWGDPGEGVDGCSVDDYVVDTPGVNAANYRCTGADTCGSVDMIENYMDYTDDACMNTFTQGQSDRSGAALTYARPNLGTSPPPTCTDGFQNGDETGMDCGGSCPSCASCTGTVNFKLNTDQYGTETSWELVRNSDSIVIESGSGYAGNTMYTFNWSLQPGDYTFTIYDNPYSDGICCGYGVGYYLLTDDSCGSTIASGGPFGASASHSFTVTAEGKVVLIPTIMMLLNKN